MESSRRANNIYASLSQFPNFTSNLHHTICFLTFKTRLICLKLVLILFIFIFNPFEVFIWIGEGANEFEKREALRTAMVKYIKVCLIRR